MAAADALHEVMTLMVRGWPWTLNATQAEYVPALFEGRMHITLPQVTSLQGPSHESVVWTKFHPSVCWIFARGLILLAL